MHRTIFHTKLRIDNTIKIEGICCCTYCSCIGGIAIAIDDTNPWFLQCTVLFCSVLSFYLLQVHVLEYCSGKSDARGEMPEHIMILARYSRQTS